MQTKKATRRVKKEKTPSEKPQSKGWEYGDLVVVCSCGSTQVIHKGVKDGLQLVLQTKEDSYIQLKCDKCDADIKLCFVEGVKPEEPTTNTEMVNEDVQEESKQEQSL